MDQQIRLVGKASGMPDAFCHTFDLRSTVTKHVARAFRVRQSVFCSAGRTTAREALARHVAIYLSHVTLGLPHSRVAEAFRRHRTSVIYACARIEDRRDDPRFDNRLSQLEGRILKALGEER